MPEYDLEWMISVDDHVIEPSHVWQDRIPKRWQEHAPKVIDDNDSGQTWIYDGRQMPIEGLAASAGRDKTEFSTDLNRYSDMRPGCYEPVERTKDMDIDRVAASVCFPSFPRFCGQVFLEAKDKELAAQCVRAYNDWMIEEWCGTVPGRLIPLVIMPLWDPVAAAAEVERCAAKGARALAFSENPTALGLPSLYDADGYWDPMFAAAGDTETVVCTHIGSSSRLPRTAPDSSLIVSTVLAPMNAVGSLVDWLFSGVLIRHPKLKLALSEGGIGWIPYVLERAAYCVDRHRYWAARDGATFKGEVETGVGNQYLDDLDVEALFRRQIFGCFIDDEFGAQNLDAVGIDNVMAESDYPHTDSNWPNTLKVMRERLAHRTDEDVWKVLQGNARRVFRFDPIIPGRDGTAEAATT